MEPGQKPGGLQRTDRNGELFESDALLGIGLMMMIMMMMNCDLELLCK